MSVKNTSIGQLLTVGVVGLVAHQAYRMYKGRGIKAGIQDAFDKKESKLDNMLADSFPASDPMPLRSGSGIN
ncbi:MAG: hypothetical protein H7249_01980 [Chitinophagaceae bacterium]|nr:hypothetical protein [Oligoflexus sp.]